MHLTLLLHSKGWSLAFDGRYNTARRLTPGGGSPDASKTRERTQRSTVLASELVPTPTRDSP